MSVAIEHKCFTQARLCRSNKPTFIVTQKGLNELDIIDHFLIGKNVGQAPSPSMQSFNSTFLLTSVSTRYFCCIRNLCQDAIGEDLCDAPPYCYHLEH